MKVFTKLLNNAKLSSNLIVKQVNGKAKPIDFFQYSTSEQFTGEYWINGKKIYQRTWQVGARGSGILTSLPLSNIDQIWIDMSNSYYVETGSQGSGNRWPINGNHGDANANGYFVSGRGPFYVPSDKKLYWTVPKSGCAQAYITFRYTKTTN